MQLCDGKKLKVNCRCGRVIRGNGAFCSICTRKQAARNQKLLESKRLKVTMTMSCD
jgi:hypothetical protein